MEKTIMTVMEEIPDYRKGNGIRHNLADILMIGLLTFICNGNDYAAMYLFAKRHEELLKGFLALPNGIPSQDTFERVFQNVNPKYLAVNFKRWVDEIKNTARQSDMARMLVGIDGKAIRRSKRAGKKAVHVVSAFASEMRLVLGEVAVDKKSNEIAAIPDLLEMFCQKGMIITIDAMGTQKDIVKKIIEKRADYVLAVKRNQETLFYDIEVVLNNEVIPLDIEELRKNGQYEKTIENDHGRIETRECFISRDADWLSTSSEWAGIAGFGVILSKREVLSQNATSYSSHYFIFSLKSTNAADILGIKRSHWAIENNLHWLLDVAFKEDESKATLGNSAETLNILRKQALQLMKQELSIKASMRSKRLLCSWDISYALNVIGVK